MTTTEPERESMTIQLPRNIMDFLRASCKNPAEYLEHSILKAIKADLEEQSVFSESLAEKYDLDAAFREFLRGPSENSVRPERCE